MFPSIRLSPSLEISTYFLIISVAVVLSSLWLIRRAESRKLERVTAIDLLLTCLVAGFAGARLLHVFYEEPSYYMENPLAALAVWNGGFVYLGGVVAAFAAGAAFCRWRQEPFWFWADTATPPAALGYALGRLACFANGCCFGRECRLPWSIHLHDADRHPTQLYASFWEFGLLGLLLALEPRLRTSGVFFNLWLLTHAGGRLLMEAFRADPRGPLHHGLSLGSWMSLGLAAFALTNLAAVLLDRAEKRHVP